MNTATARAGLTALVDWRSFDDVALAAALREGNPEAFSELYRRYRPVVERVCRHQLVDGWHVDEAVQQTFVALSRRLARFEGGALLRRYVMKTARCTALDVRRKAQAVLARERSDGGRHELVAAGSAEAAQDARQTAGALLQGLGAKDRALLSARYLEDQSLSTMAAAWGSTPSAIGVRLHRARARARQFATAQGLRELLPLPLVRAIDAVGRWVQALPPEVATGVVAVAAPLVAVAAVTLALSGGGLVQLEAAPAGVVERSAAQPSTAAAADAPRTAPEPSPGEEPTLSAEPPSATAAGASPAADPAASGAADPPPTRAVHPPAVEFEHVQAPVTGSVVAHQDPPPQQQPDFDYGVSQQVGPQFVDVAVESYDEPEHAAVHDAGCLAAGAADPLTYCERS